MESWRWSGLRPGCARHDMRRSLGQRMLAWLARPRWKVTWQESYADVDTGAWVHIDHPLSPIAGRHRPISAESLDLSAASLTCTVEALVGDALQLSRQPDSPALLIL